MGTYFDLHLFDEVDIIQSFIRASFNHLNFELSISEITILKRGSIKNITVYDNSIDVPQLQLSPTFESGSRSFSVHTNNSNVLLNIHSDSGTCKLIKNGGLISFTMSI